MYPRKQEFALCYWSLIAKSNQLQCVNPCLLGYTVRITIYA